MTDEKAKRELRVLMLEDTLTDAELAEHELRKAGIAFVSTRVDTKDAFIRALADFHPDIVLSDYQLPDFDGMEALKIVRSDYPEIPVIMVTGALSDIDGVELIHAGAKDYVLKDRLARLASAVLHVLSMEQGIRERKQAEKALRDSEARYRRITEGLTDYQYTVRIENGVVAETTQSTACETVTGYTAEEFVANPYLWIQMVVPEDRELVTARVNQILAGQDVPPMEHRIVRKDGVPRWVNDTTILFKDAAGKLLSYDGVIKDVTERRMAENALRESEEKFRGITDAAQDAILMMDNEGKISYWNAAAEKIFGYTEQEAVGQVLHDLLVPQRFHAAFNSGHAHFRKTGAGVVVGKSVELAGLRKDGREFPLELSLSAIKRGDQWHAIGIIRDIGERKMADAGVRLFRALVDQSNDAIEVSDPATYRLIDVNETACRNLGYSRDELLSMRIQDVDPDINDFQLKKIGEALRAHGSTIIETRHRRKDGSTFPVEVSLTAVHVDKDYVISMVRDITERKQAEEALLRLNRTLRALSAGNHALVHSENEKSLLENMCRAAAEGGYILAWVGYALQDETKRIVPMAMCGEGAAYVEALNLTWDDQPSGCGPTGTAVRTGRTQIVSDIMHNPLMEPWREMAEKYGLASNIALPLSGNGQVIGALTIYASEPEAFGPDQVALLEEMASDLAFGIVTLRLRAEHEQHATILRQSLEQSIQTIAGTLEARDPYTAGHQRRVSELATAIAKEIGLPEAQVNGIHLAAIIHDLGKIHIPAEILAKPGKLTDIEFMLIKTHPQAGYDILKNVKYPWPIADIILQHHERLDGSGYPQGLKDGEILLEARILTVADVVEAMSSHRPYRPTLGIEIALSEIERGRGSKYDSTIVDACLRLFAIKGFEFSSASPERQK